MRQSARLLAILCLLLMQAQLFAASALGCRHEGAPASDPAASGCPYHPAEAGVENGVVPSPTLECQKCSLHCAVGVNAQINAMSMPAVWQPHARPDATPPQHFYRFTPESSSRPPTEVFS